MGRQLGAIRPVGLQAGSQEQLSSRTIQIDSGAKDECSWFLESFYPSKSSRQKKSPHNFYLSFSSVHSRVVVCMGVAFMGGGNQ